MKKCPFCGKGILESADFCPFCMALLKEKIPISFIENRFVMKKLIIPCIALVLAVTVALLTFGNIKPNDNSNLISSNVSDNSDENSNSSINDGVSSPSVIEPNNQKPTNNDSANNQKPNDNTDDTTATPQGPSEDNKTETDNGDNNQQNGENSGNNTGGNSSGSTVGSTSGGSSSSVTTTPTIPTTSSTPTTPSTPTEPEEIVDSTGLFRYRLDQITDSTHGGKPYTAAVITHLGPNTSVKQTGNLFIPSTLDGYPVARIDTRAFQSNDNIVSLTISEGITSLGDYAFKACFALKNISLPNSLETLGKEVFAYYGHNYWDSLSIKLPPNLKVIPEGTFCGAKALDYIETYATKIEKNAFKDVTALEMNFLNKNEAPYFEDGAFEATYYPSAALYCPFTKAECHIGNNEYLNNVRWYLIP